MEVNEFSEEFVTEGDKIDDYRCKHYKRKCKFVTPCCDGLYRCRFCHDEEQDHTLRRDDVTQVECSRCNHRQEVRETCRKCGLKFGEYFCYECKLYDDEDKQQFHCTGCGICRVGGRENYFHCDRCDMCLPNHLENKHKCVEKVSRSNCPVCMEDIHTSRIPSQIPPCNHLIHKTCFEEMLSSGHYACPVCGVSMMDMTDVWKLYDKEIQETPMPSEYEDMYAAIQCKDCSNSSLAKFHVLGMKCGACGGYNTVRDKGPLVRKVKPREQGSDSGIETEGEGEGAHSDTDSSESSGSSVPMPSLIDNIAPNTEVEPMDADSGPSYPLPALTPPETPTREEQLHHRGLTSISSDLEMLTPEPSPLRESLVQRPSPVSQAVQRRISFTEDESSSQNH